MSSSVNIDEIREIISLMEQSELAEFEIEKEGLKLRIHRNSAGAVVMPPQVMAPAAALAPEVSAPEAKSEDYGSIIKSPLVGTFYASSSPDNPAFVSAGSRVSSDSVVAIVEAMKVMNEIQAEISGEILEVLVENGQAVEFGQPLFRVKEA